MTTPPPYGKTAEQAETPSSDFGATTVSGKPSNGRGADTEPKAATAPPAASTTAPTAAPAPSAPAPSAPAATPPKPADTTPAGSPSSTRPTPPPVGPATTPSAPPVADRTGAMPAYGPPATVPGSAAPPLAGPPRVAAPLPGPVQAPAPHRPSRADASRGPRRARLQLRHIDPWTVLKFSCVLSIALFFVWLIVVGVLFGILDAAGVVGKINDSVILINGAGSKAPVTAGIVFGGAAIIGVINIVLFIALSTIGAVVYNLCADLVGGIEVTLSER